MDISITWFLILVLIFFLGLIGVNVIKNTLLRTMLYSIVSGALFFTPHLLHSLDRIEYNTLYKVRYCYENKTSRNCLLELPDKTAKWYLLRNREGHDEKRIIETGKIVILKKEGELDVFRISTTE